MNNELIVQEMQCLFQDRIEHVKRELEEQRADEQNRKLWKEMQRARYVPMGQQPAYKALSDRMCDASESLRMLSDAEEKDPEDEGLRQTADQFEAEVKLILDEMDRLAKVLEG